MRKIYFRFYQCGVLEASAGGWTFSGEVQEKYSKAAILLTFRRCCGSGSGIRSALLAPESGISDGKNLDSGPGSGINIPNHISKSLITILGLKIFKYFVAYLHPDPDSG
jgi:hypothetical protein